MCTVQNPTTKMTDTLSWKDRVMASVDKTPAPMEAHGNAKRGTSSHELHRTYKPCGVSSHGKGMNGVQKNDTSYAMRRKKKTKRATDDARVRGGHATLSESARSP